MRIQFVFSINKLPISYRLGTLSIIKEMIRQGSSKFYNKIFEKNKDKMKPFSHATYINNLKFVENEIHGDKLVLTVSSSSYEFIMYLMNGSQRNTTYKYKDYNLELIQKRLLPKPPEFTSVVTFKTGSPILIEDVNNKPLLIKDNNFEEEFNYYAQLLTKELFNRNLYEPIKIIKASMKKVVIKENVHQSLNNPIYMTANHGLIQLKGSPQDLKIIYENGIGLRRSLGLGLLNVEEVTHL